MVGHVAEAKAAVHCDWVDNVAFLGVFLQDRACEWRKDRTVAQPPFEPVDSGALFVRG
jgi:hypothetical protein